MEVVVKVKKVKETRRDENEGVNIKKEKKKIV